jgi:catechol 2,3-dioxygenase-like lactoylglutathione lyase family enzyme
MPQTIGHVALVIRDYDEAIAFFTKKLGLQLIEDSASTDRLGRNKRWVLVAPGGSSGTSLLLARASSPEEESMIGNQTGGRVFLFLHTDDFWKDFREMTSRGVKFCREPRKEA